MWGTRATFVRGLPPYLNIQKSRGLANLGRSRVLKDTQKEGSLSFICDVAEERLSVSSHCLEHSLCSILSAHQVDPLQEPDFFQVSKLFSIRDLVNANVHLGHHEGCWNPFMKPYIYGTRERFHVIDLDKTSTHLKVQLPARNLDAIKPLYSHRLLWLDDNKSAASFQQV